MATLKYGNVKDVETDFKQAPIGVYTLKAMEVSPKTKDGKGEMVEVRFEPTHDSDGKKLKDNFASIFYYAPLSVDDWGGETPHPSWLRRLKELVISYGLKETGGDLSKIEGKSCLARLAKDEDQDGEYRPRIAKLMSANSKGSADDDDDEDEEGEDEVDLDEMDRDDLKSFIKEQELGIRVLQKYSDDDIRDKIREVIGEDEEEEEDEDEEEDETEDEVDLDDLDRDELKAFIKENDLDVKVLKKDDEDALRAKIQEALGEDEDEEEEEEDEDEGDNYEEMSVADLREECENRELETKGTKKVLVARLRKDDATDPV